MERADPSKRRLIKPRTSKTPREPKLSLEAHAQQIMIALAIEIEPRIGDAFSLTVHDDPATGRLRISISQTGRGRTPFLTHQSHDRDAMQTKLSSSCRALLASQAKEACRLSWTAGQRGSLTIALMAVGSADAAHAKAVASR